MELLSYFDLHFIYLTIFSLGLSFGAGGAVLSALLFITSMKDGTLSDDEYQILEQSRKFVWFGVILYTFAGIGLFTLSAEAMMKLGFFYASMTFAVLMLLSTFIFHSRHLPEIKKRIKKGLADVEGKKVSTNLNVHLIICETVSVVSWVFLILHHAMYRLPVNYSAAMTVYVASVLVVGYVFFVYTKHIFTRKNIALLKAMALFSIIILLAFATTTSINGVTNTSQQREVTITQAREEVVVTTKKDVTYTYAEVKMHSNIEDCWVVIDGAVFDASPAAEKYPEVYSCGEDSTENYRKVREEGISDRVRSYQIGLLGFPFDEVISHDTNDNCWIIIDELVFDATIEATLHPAAFNCGTNASANYHRNHGDGISDRMMESHIGSIDDGVSETFTGNPVTKTTELKPYRELYVEEGFWDNHELIVVVEKDPEKLLFIDGLTHTELGRIHDVGFQPHTSVYSPDAKYMYIIARDGWLTKIDLDTMEPIKSISVGENSRGTALTDDGKYLAIGNYNPADIVMVDPETMEILKKIPTVGDLDGKEVHSRVGAMIEDGDKIIAALKDLNSVWIIDTSKPDFPVIAKHWNIGKNQTPLHDAFLSADGRYYVVASMGSDTVWVMDTDTWEPVKEVPTGKTPHTGPGATWGNKVYIPALGEGLITAIDMTTWEPVASIKTGGPGLFIRAFNEDPEYPYVWAETAFGENHDEIYVIDARIDEIVKTIRPVEGESSWHPEFTNDGNFVYIVSQTANEVEVYDAHTFELVKRIESETPSAVSNIGNRIEEFGL